MKVLSLVLCAALWAGAALALAADGEGEEEGLLAILDEETAVATRSRMNSDFVPGIVSVLHGDELEALGIETVGEALSLVPGIQAVRGASGTPSVVVRGIDFPFNSGNVKVLVNSVPLSRESAGINGIVLDLPIHQVDRIEVIRGPGSVLYGDFAFMGLVNVITRQDGASLLGRYGGDAALSGGARAAWKSHDARTTVALSAAGLTNDDAPVTDAASVASERRGFGAFTLGHGGLRLTAEAIHRDLDFAQAGPADDQTHWTLEARYGRALRPKLHAEMHASYLHNRFVAQFAEFEGNTTDVGGELQWTGWKGHEWLLGLAYSAGRIDTATFTFGLPAPDGQPAPGIRISGQERNVVSAFLQDRIDVSDRVAITAGARIDQLSDVDTRITPRLSLVLRASDHNIVKLQYAEGFRAPTFFELYMPAGARNPDLASEVNGTAELNFVHRRPRTVIRTTLFHSKIRDMLFLHVGPGPGPVFDNRRTARSNGAEFEVEQDLAGRRLRLRASASWVDERDDRNLALTSRTSPPAADWLASAMLLWRPRAGTTFGGRWSHVGRRHDPAATDGYDLVDLTLSQSDLLRKRVELRWGVKNVFDSTLRYVTAVPERAVVDTFPGRTFWAQLSFRR